MAITAAVYPGIGAGILMLVLAAVLAYLNFASRANRAFALLLVVRGIALIAVNLGGAADTFAEAVYWWSLYPYFMIAFNFAIIYFLAVYPAPRRLLGRRSLVLLPIAILFLAAEFLYFSDHTLWWNVLALDPALRNPQAAPVGPLFPLVDLWDVTFALAAYVLARDFSIAPPGPRRRSILLMSTGFGVVALFDGLDQLILSSLQAIPEAYPGRNLYGVFIIVVAAATLLSFRSRARLGSDDEVRSAAGAYTLWQAAVVLSALIYGAIALLLSFDAGFAVRTFVAGVWRLALPLLATYALLRHQLFDIDLKVKWTIKQSTVAAVFISVFFIASEAAQQFFQGNLGPYVGIAAAGVLVFALAPLQRFAEHVSDTALPGVANTPEYLRYRRFEVYKGALENAMRDGVITDRERDILEGLRHDLDISDTDARTMESEVLRVARA